MLIQDQNLEDLPLSVTFFTGNWSTDDIPGWLEYFHANANLIAGSDFLHFTAEILIAGSDFLHSTAEISKPNNTTGEQPANKSVTASNDESFPFLDMKMYWRDDLESI